MEELINIAEALNNNKLEYELKENENVGFVFPVYFYTVPDIVKEFVSKLKLSNVTYVYAVITCGGGIMQAGSVLKKLLQDRKIKLDYVSPLLMPDNSMLFYQIPKQEKNELEIMNAVKKIEAIKNDLNNHKQISISNISLISDLVGQGYKLCNKTSKFYADDNCVGCGLCEKICPQRAIVLKDSKPKWIKDTCSKCSGCINRCPKHAIQYGKTTVKRNRYINPEL